MGMYYTLIVKYSDKWSPEFGDYDKSVVSEERNEYHDYPTMILQTEDTQDAIDSAVEIINLKGY
jgi:hypothetical protein